MPSQDNSSIESDALKANLLETAVEEVVVDSAYAVLTEIVHDYKGLISNLEHLLYEISHPFRNWAMILPKFRAFVLKNIHHYLQHKKGPKAFELFAEIFNSGSRKG